MEIEVGEYVRTNNGVIAKLVRIERDDIDTSLKWYVLSNEHYINKPYIVNHNKIISEIVEVGDYVNGHRVEQVSVETNEVLLDHNGFGWRTLKYGDKIVTHEQMASIEYKVEESK